MKRPVLALHADCPAVHMSWRSNAYRPIWANEGMFVMASKGKGSLQRRTPVKETLVLSEFGDATY